MTALIAYVIRFMPFGMRYVYSGVLQLHRELEEAAGVAGAGYLATLRRIVAPLLTPAMIAGWLFIFLIANKELAIATLLGKMMTREPLNHSIQKKSSKKQKMRERASRRKCEPHPLSLCLPSPVMQSK